MKNVTLQVPDDLYQAVEARASEEDYSVDEWIHECCLTNLYADLLDSLYRPSATVFEGYVYVGRDVVTFAADTPTELVEELLKSIGARWTKSLDCRSSPLSCGQAQQAWRR